MDEQQLRDALGAAPTGTATPLAAAARLREHHWPALTQPARKAPCLWRSPTASEVADRVLDRRLVLGPDDWRDDDGGEPEDAG